MRMLVPLFTSLILLFVTNTSAADPNDAMLERQTRDSFLTPLALNFDVHRRLPTPIRRIGDLRRNDSGDDMGGAGDVLTNGTPPHLQVAFNLSTLENIAVANGGATQNMRIRWWAHSAEATWESDWDPSSYIPGPGSTIYFDAPFYVGEVTNGCGNVPVFPIEFTSDVYAGDQVLGDYAAYDNSTIQPNGYWNFAYVIRVTDDNGGTSDIEVKGIVSAVCVW